MQKQLVGLIAALLTVAPTVTRAQERSRPTSATDVTKADIETVLASPEGGIDRQVRVIDAGNSNVAVGILHRGPTLGTDDAVGGLVHTEVAEVYYVLSGSGMLTTGGTLDNPEPRPPDSESVTILVGPSIAGTSRNGHTRRISAGDVVVIPAGVFHGWSDIEDHVTYLSVRPDTGRVLPAGYVNPALEK
jgi:mannose-6-phosphate isomerase-like protein (cupin superfamily)